MTETDLAKRMFETDDDPVALQDRAKYRGIFDAMPAGLQEWWRYRAERQRLTEQRLRRP
jgi:hypothetical protein